jgi:hypothetical protein
VVQVNQRAAERAHYGVTYFGFRVKQESKAMKGDTDVANIGG